MASGWSWWLLFCLLHIEASVIVVNEGSSFNVSCSWPVPVYQYYWNIKPKLLDTDGEGDCTESMTQYHCHVYHASLEHVGNYNITLYRIKALGASVDVQTCHVTIEVIPLNNDQVSTTDMMSSIYSIFSSAKTKSSSISTMTTRATSFSIITSSSDVVHTNLSSTPSDDVTLIAVMVTVIGLLLSSVLIITSIVLFIVRYKLKQATKQHRRTSDTGFLLGKEREDLYEKNNDSNEKEIVSFVSILFQELVSKSTFTLIHHARIKQSDALVKQLKDSTSKLGKIEITHEIDVLKELSAKGAHPNIVLFIGTTVDPDPLCLVMEYLPYGSLHDFLTYLHKGPIPDWYMEHVVSSTRGLYNKQQISDDLFNVLLQIAEGAEYLADSGIVHGHLSTANVLLGKRLAAKLCNFTIHQSGDYFKSSERASYLQDLAPEVIIDGEHTTKSDVWSFGILMYRITTFESREPFATKHDIDSLHQLMSQGVRPPPLGSHSDDLYYQMQQCWRFNKEERPNFSQILKTLQPFAQSPWTHLLFEISKKRRGHTSNNHQIHLHPPPAQFKSSSQPFVLLKGQRCGLQSPSASSKISFLSGQDDTTSGQASDFSSDTDQKGSTSKKWFQMKKNKSRDDLQGSNLLKSSQSQTHNSAELEEFERNMLLPTTSVTRKNPLLI